MEITSAGELDAKNSVNIEGPFGLRRARIWEVKIEDMVDEGTVVKKGDYVARLDPAELSDRIQNEENDLVQTTSKYTQARLDTALELRKERDNLINLKYDVLDKLFVELLLEEINYYKHSVDDLNLINNIHNVTDRTIQIPQIKKVKSPTQKNEEKFKQLEKIIARTPSIKNPIIPSIAQISPELKRIQEKIDNEQIEFVVIPKEKLVPKRPIIKIKMSDAQRMPSSQDKGVISDKKARLLGHI